MKYYIMIFAGAIFIGLGCIIALASSTMDLYPYEKAGMLGVALILCVIGGTLYHFAKKPIKEESADGSTRNH